MDEPSFPTLARLACHDLRTPLATISGVAKLLLRQDGLAEGNARMIGMIDDAAAELAQLVDQLATAARIAAGAYAPELHDADTLELARAADARIAVDGRGTTVTTDVEAVADALERLALAALRFGGVETVTWRVSGRSLVLSPLAGSAAAVVAGSSPRDLGALVARAVLEALGGSLAAEPEALRVELGSAAP